MATLTIDKAQRSLLDPTEDTPTPRLDPVERTAPARPGGRPEPHALVDPGERTAPLDAATGASARARTGAHGATLDDLVGRTWSALADAHPAPCLLCGGEVAPRYGSGAHPVGGTCRSCGTEIA